MSPKNILVLLVAFVLVTSSLAILPSSSPANNDAKPQPHTPKPPDHNKPSPHFENGRHDKPPPHTEDVSNDGKPPHHGKPPPHKPPPHMEDASYNSKPHHGKPPPPHGDKPQYFENTSYDDKLTHPDSIPPRREPPRHEPPHHGKPPPIGTTKELPPKEQQSTQNRHPRPGHGGHNVESTNFRPIDPPGSD